MSSLAKWLFLLIPILILGGFLFWPDSNSTISTSSSPIEPVTRLLQDDHHQPPIKPNQQEQQQQQQQQQVSTVLEEPAAESDAASCPLKSNSFRDLGTFPFWGRLMNSSFPCPAAGMNNQLTLFIAFWFCYENMMLRKLKKSGGEQQQQQQQSVSAMPGFRWKDITCSPTGGKEGSRKFVVGSSDYVYAWFRWSEVYQILPRSRIFDLEDGGEAAPVVIAPLCLHDKYTWKEHPELGRCQSNIGHLYGSLAWWKIRGRLLPLRRYSVVVECFFESLSKVSSSGEDQQQQQRFFDDCVSNSDRQHKPPLSSGVLGIHVRRGDYAHFCKGLTGSSGIRKFRVPPYKWLSRSRSRGLASRFPDTCAPGDGLIADHIKGIARRSSSSSSGDGVVSKVRFVFVASNSPTFIRELRTSLTASSSLRVVSMSDMLALLPQNGARWPEKLALPFQRGAQVSVTDRVTLDIVALAVSEQVVLNRYSTFSQSVIDERVLRGGLGWNNNLTGSERVFWW